MSGTTITSNTNAGYYLGDTTVNPVKVASGVTITDVNNPAVGSAVPTYWTIVNYGTLLATGRNGFSDGILLNGGGGAVTNMAGGSIAGYYFGVSLTGSGTVVNDGAIATDNAGGTGFVYTGGVFTATTAGVLLSGGGGVSNAASGVITSYLDGVAVGDGGSVVNAGTIIASSPSDGIGVVLTAGGSLTNTQTGTILAGLNAVLGFGQASTVFNQGVIYSRDNLGVGLFAGGVLTNASTGQISGYSDGVYIGRAAGSTITNAGVLYGYKYAGAVMNAGGSVTNADSGFIYGRFWGVKVNNDTGSVLNAGTIADGAVFDQTSTFDSAGVQLGDGGVVTNAAGGVIDSKWKGVEIGGSLTSSIGGTVVNYGTILAADAAGDGAGVWIHGSGAITNAAGGIISGGGFGIVAYYQTTVVNQGTIFGASFAFDPVHSGFAQRIIDLPGGVFSGTVSGGNTLGSAVYSTLELASGSSTGTIVNAGTFVNFGRIALDAGAKWSVGGSLVAGETIAFGGTHASLILTSPSAAAATITGFAATDTIVLSGITDVSQLSFGAGDTLTVSRHGGPGLTLHFDKPLDLTDVVVNGSTDIFLVPCFLPGTHILTDRGEVLVEKLQVGDLIVTLSGRTRRLCWIGQGRTLATRGRRTAATPVIVRKGALADNVPYLDLHITKGHSLYFDGALIPVEFLVNHRSILWDDRAQEVTVFHLELDEHDVLIANGVPAESYRDDGNRWLFQNANAGWDQPPKMPCAPVLTGGALVDTIWQLLLDRAGPRPGVPLTDDPDLHLVVDGERIDAHEQHDQVHVFRLARPPASIRIASRDAVPAELGLARDSRSLGVALRRIAVRQGSKFTVLKANDIRLADGFYEYEAPGNLRWTNGDATLPVAAFAQFRGGVEVVLDLAATTQYPNRGGRSARAAA
jgi:hypothetical protein